MTHDLDDNDFCVVGIGTRLSRDDEIGLQLVEDLRLETEFAHRCILMESADAAYMASFLLETPKSMLLVDCADMGIPAGEHRLFQEHEACVKIHSDSVSTHGMGLAEGLALARVLGFTQSVHIFAVQPFDLSPAIGLTEEMSARYARLLENLISDARQLRRSTSTHEGGRRCADVR